MTRKEYWVVQADKETICCEGARVARAYDPEFPEGVTKRTEANAKRIVLCVNRHDKLVEALKELTQFDEHGGDGSSNHYILIKRAKEALSLAEGV